MVKDSHDRLSTVFERWWKRLNDTDDAGERGEKANRADLARLRRIGAINTATGPRVDIALALTIGEFRTLYVQVRSVLSEPPDWDESLVVAAATLARVRKNVAGETARLLGVPPDADRPLMAESRFLRLMRVRTETELLDQARGFVALIGPRGAPVGDLGASLTVWLTDAKRRRLWAEAYYGLNAPTTETLSSNQNTIDVGAVPS
jgi:CRISPR system Cascade subunit CasB